MKRCILLLALVGLASCNNDVNQLDAEASHKPLTSVEDSTKLQMKVQQLSPTDFGYQIYKGGKMLINQTTVPSIPGNAGFSSYTFAEKTGRYVMEKIEKGIFPPTISPAELDSLGVLLR